MAVLTEDGADRYDWEKDGIYMLQAYDPVEGGENGISNEQAKALALRTRNLHNRTIKLEAEIAELKAMVRSLTTPKQTENEN